VFSKEEHRTPTTEFHRQVTWTCRIRLQDVS
jgi:hypothetical protein